MEEFRLILKGINVFIAYGVAVFAISDNERIRDDIVRFLKKFDSSCRL